MSALLPALECSFSLEVAGFHVLVSGTLLKHFFSPPSNPKPSDTMMNLLILL